MTSPLNDLAFRLESQLPALPAGMVRMCRTSIARTAETATVARVRLLSVGGTLARTNIRAAKTVIGQTRSAVVRTIEFTGDRIAEVRGQASYQASAAASATNSALVDLVEDVNEQVAAVQPLRAMTKAELYERAQGADIAGRSDMTKQQLVDVLSA
jgi:hypothetical protein